MASLLSPKALTHPAACTLDDGVNYPSGDGQPRADNTLHWDWIAKIKLGLDMMFVERSDVFIAADLLWYYRKGDNRARIAPDVMVAFGRPKGGRMSYIQWLEGGVPFQVVFEVLSQKSRGAVLARKFLLYDELGVLEYYTYNPGNVEEEPGGSALVGWRRDYPTQPLKKIQDINGWRSPLLGVTFWHQPGEDLRIVRLDGRPFETFLESNQRVSETERQAEYSEQRAQQSERRNLELRAKCITAGIDPDTP